MLNEIQVKILKDNIVGNEYGNFCTEYLIDVSLLLKIETRFIFKAVVVNSC